MHPLYKCALFFLAAPVPERPRRTLPYATRNVKIIVYMFPNYLTRHGGDLCSDLGCSQVLRCSWPYSCSVLRAWFRRLKIPTTRLELKTSQQNRSSRMGFSCAQVAS